jgi:hypothetical protein
VFELHSGVIRCELPVDTTLLCVAVSMPGFEAISQGFKIRNSVVTEALLSKCRKFNFCNIPLAAVFWCVVDFQAAGQFKRISWYEGLVE